jgi:hypothetical protein
MPGPEAAEATEAAAHASMRDLYTYSTMQQPMRQPMQQPMRQPMQQPTPGSHAAAYASMP